MILDSNPILTERDIDLDGVLERLLKTFKCRSPHELAQKGIVTSPLELPPDKRYFYLKELINVCLENRVKFEWILTGVDDLYGSTEGAQKMVRRSRAFTPRPRSMTSSLSSEGFMDFGGQGNESDLAIIKPVSGRIRPDGRLEPDQSSNLKIGLKRGWLSRRGSPDHLSILRIDANDMHPVLNNGDLVVIDHNIHETGAGGLYALDINHQIIVREVRVDLATDRLKVVAHRPQIETQLLEPGKVRIVGKVILLIREL